MYLSINFDDFFTQLLSKSGFSTMTIEQVIMLGIACVLVYLAIVKKFEPLLLLPIAFGMFIINIPGAKEILYGVIDKDASEIVGKDVYVEGTQGLFYFLYKGIELVIYPPLIFLGIGAMTDFGPVIANPKSLLLGGAAQLGIFIAFAGALLLGYTEQEAGSIGIIGGADGPTAIYLTSKLAPNLLPAIAIAAYSYMALIPVIQPPLMRMLTTKKERMIKMSSTRTVSKLEKIIFPLSITAIIGIILPDAIPLLGMLMLGNLMRESGVVERITKTASNELINIVTIFLGITVGSKAYGPEFLDFKTLGIIIMGLVAFCFGTIGGVLMAKFMNLFSKNKINPLIGSAGVSAVPMAARVSHNEGLKYDSENYLLMHAMGPNVAGVICSAVAAGVILALFL